MLTFLFLALLVLAVCLVFLMPFLLGTEVYKRYSGTRVVACPEIHRQVAVDLNAVRAARTALVGKPSLKIAGCTRWPERADCGQECIPEAAQAGVQQEVALKPGPIFHFPVLLAASVAWIIGALWHSQYLFRAEWREAIGLSRWEAHALGWSLTPHLLTLAAPLLFAYGVAVVLAWIGRPGPIMGATVSILMWAAFVLALFAVTGFTSLSQELMKLELGYTFLAALVVGFTIGELNGMLIRRHAAH